MASLGWRLVCLHRQIRLPERRSPLRRLLAGYPLVARLLLFLPIPWQLALLIVSNGAALAAFVLVGTFVYRETLHEQAAIWAVLLLAVSPLGVFLSAFYSDSAVPGAGCWGMASVRESGHWRLAGVLLHWPSSRARSA